MHKVIIASKNPVKLAATKAAFEAMFPHEEWVYETVEVASGINEQPLTDNETLQGAKNRADNAKVVIPSADYWVGLESGLEKKAGTYESFAWMVVISREGTTGQGRTASFVLPVKVAALIDGGMELGAADDVVFGKKNSKQQNGAVGLLTDDVLTRTAYYEQAVIMALIPHKNPTLY